MAIEEIFDLNTLNKLQDRAVRGAKPGTTNARKSGRLYVTTGDQSAQADLKEYLVQAADDQNIFTGTASFFNDSKMVYGSGFNLLLPGYSIRLSGDLTSYKIASISSPTYLLLATVYKAEQSSTIGTYTARKVLFNELFVDSVSQNTGEGTGFSYDFRSSSWKEVPGVSHSAPVLTSTSAFPLADDIELHAISRNASPSPSPDMQAVGTVKDKEVRVEQEGQPFISLPLVPYPGDHSSLRMSRKRPQDASFSEVYYGQDFFVDYKRSPIYTKDQPPFALRSQASLFPTVGFQASMGIDANFKGSWAVASGSERISSIIEGSEVVERASVNEIEFLALTLDNVANNSVLLAAAPSGTVSVLIVSENTEVPSSNLSVSGRILSWTGFGLGNPAPYAGMSLKITYLPIPGSYGEATGSVLSGGRVLYPYQEYILDQNSGYLTTVTTKTGATTAIQHSTLSPANIENKNVPLFGAPLGSLAVNSYHGTALSLGVDYKIEGGRISWDGLPNSNIGNGRNDGLRLIYELSAGEFPVKVVMYKDSFFENGIEVYRLTGSFADVEAVDIKATGTRIYQDIDYNFNEKNGTFRFTKDLMPEDTIAFFYLVGGTRVSGEILAQSRTEHYPVMQGSVLAQASTDNGYVVLEEGTDFDFSYMTGVLTPLPGVVYNKISIDYTPCAPMLCLVKKDTEGSSYLLRTQGEPAVVSGPTTINVYNSLITASSAVNDIAVADRVGKPISAQDIKFLPDTKKVTFRSDSSLANGQVVRLSYTMKSSALPFAPIIRVPKTLVKGRSAFLTDGSAKAASDMTEGKVMMLSPADNRIRYYHMISGNYDAGDSVNREIVLTGALQDSFREPLVMISDKEVVFSPVSTQISPYRKNDTLLTATGDHTFTLAPGHFLKIKEELYRIMSSTFSNGSTTLAIDPPALNSESSASTLSSVYASEEVVYVEGDNAIVTKYPVYAEHPLWNLVYNRVDGYAEASFTDDLLLIKEHGDGGEAQYSITLADYPLATDLATAVETLAGGRFGIEWLFQRIDDFLTASIIPDNFFQILPKKINTATQVTRTRAGESTPSLLKYGRAPGQGDYYVQGGIIVLKDGLQKGDTFCVDYLGVDNHRNEIGSSLSISGRKVDAQPAGTLYRMSCDYYKPDQFYVESLKEADYFNQVVQPYLDQLDARAEGQQPSGAEGASVAPAGNSTGGIQDNYFLLREEYLKKELYSRIHSYYLDRMGFMATEHEYIVGKRLGNNDFTLGESDTRFGISNYNDATFTATFGSSRVYPLGYEGSNPAPDARFLAQYVSYGRVNFFNAGGLGVVYGDNPEFITRGFAVGDKVRPLGTAKWYEIGSVVSQKELRLTEALVGQPSPTYSYVNGTYYAAPLNPYDPSTSVPVEAPNAAFDYEVLRSSSPAYPVLDDRGFAGAQVYGSLLEPYSLTATPSYDNVLVVETSFDGGYTFHPREVDLSFLTAPYTADRVAEALLTGSVGDGLKDLFKITAEPRYVAPGVDTSLSVSESWPLTLPEKTGSTGYGISITFRANSADMLFRFTEPMESIYVPTQGATYSMKKSLASKLGLMVDTIFSGNNNTGNATTQVISEMTHRGGIHLQMQSLLGVYDRLSRSAPRYITPLKETVAKATRACGTLLDSVDTAKENATLLLEETSATPAITQSFDRATVVLPKYASMQVQTLLARARDSLLSQGLESYVDYVTNAPSFYDQDSDQLQDQLASQILAGAGPVVSLDASLSPDFGASPRILFGDKTEGAQVLGIPVFPRYGSSASSKVPGSWYTTSAVSLAAIKLDSPSYFYQYSVTSTNLVLKYKSSVSSSWRSLVIGFYSNATLGKLVASINALAAGVLTASLTNGTTADVSSYDLMKINARPQSYVLGTGYILKAELSYSSLASQSFKMGTALKINALEAGTYTTSDTDISIHTATTGTKIFSYAAYPTLALLTNAIALQMYPTVVALVQWSDVNYRYGRLARCTKNIYPHADVFFGVQSDIRFWYISNKNLDMWMATELARVQECTVYPSILAERASQLRDAVGNESLVDNKGFWFNLLANRQEGPCAKMVQIKKQLLKK